MIRQLRTGAAGMQAQSFKVDTIANNIANINNDGFQRSSVSFRDLVYQAVSGPGNPVVPDRENGRQVGGGTRAEAATVFSQGILRRTGRDLDFGIAGGGFLRLLLPDGREVYTRSGAFGRDAAGNLVTAQGYKADFLTGKPPETTSFTVSTDGRVQYFNQEGKAGEGTAVIYRFRNPSGLERLGNNMYAPTDNSGQAEAGQPGQNGFGLLRQGDLESSNVNLTEEMTELIMTQRAYELNSRAVRTADEMWAMANQIRR